LEGEQGRKCTNWEGNNLSKNEERDNWFLACVITIMSATMKLLCCGDGGNKWSRIEVKNWLSLWLMFTCLGRVFVHSRRFDAREFN